MKRGKSFLALIGLAFVGVPAVAATSALAAEPLRGAVDVEARRALMGKAQKLAECPTPPAPVKDVIAEPFYSDAAGSVVDEARYKARVEATRPIGDFAAGVVKHADLWLGSKPALPAAARCALAWLDQWAKAEAMLGRVTNQGGYERKWVLAGVALAFLKIRDAPDLDRSAKARAREWFARLAREVRAHYDKPPGKSAFSDRLNNHSYWAALAVGAAGIAADDRALWDWAVAKYDFALTQVEPDGTLPLEIKRAGKALHYHLFSVAPLVMLAELGAANGLDLHARQSGALKRLVDRAVSGLADPAYFQTLAGAEQDFVGKLTGWHFAWAEIWHARTRDLALAPFLKKHRPARNVWLGGDATLAFGVKDLP